MRGADVEVLVLSWLGDHEAGPAEQDDSILVTDLWFRVDGQLVRRGHDAGYYKQGMAADCKLICDGFLELHVSDPPDWLREKYGDPSMHLMGTHLDSDGPLDLLKLNVHSLRLLSREERGGETT